MDSETKTGLFTLAGVIIGFALTEAVEWFRRRNRRTAVAGLLYIELKQILLHVNDVLDVPEGAVKEQFGAIPTPAYDAHSGELATLFPSELVDGVAVFYSRVSAFNTIATETARAAREFRSAKREEDVVHKTAIIRSGSSDALSGVGASMRHLAAVTAGAKKELLELFAEMKSYARQVRLTAENIEPKLKRLAPKHTGEQLARLSAIVAPPEQQE